MESFQCEQLARGWGCPSPATSPPSPSGAPPRGVSVICGPHPHVARPRPRSRSRSRSPSRLSTVSPVSTGSASSDCSVDRRGGHALLEAPLATLGVLGYPYPYAYQLPAAATPPSPVPAAQPAPPGPGPGPTLDALADLYAPLHLHLHHAYSYPQPPRPLRPWLPWRGLGGPAASPAGPLRAAPVSAPPPSAPAHPAALKFGMDRILSAEGCGPGSRRSGGPGGADGSPSDGSSSRDLVADLVAYPVPTASSLGLLAPTPLRLYAADPRSAGGSPPRGDSLRPQGLDGLGQSGPHGASGGGGAPGKRKRSWSRAVFSNLQRKGLEKRFQLQKYITKPDRRQLAATLGLTDAQVKVWFQNRRMKWRHTKESKQQHQPQAPAPRLDDLHQDSSKCDAPAARCDSSS
ncbi:H2.0-like homeobox protein [Frankliniella fusca]|uniref:H2.0-like homeobox protein n=1 Tax=Frankliniella fusca TaxID=407009 RepID=A0AAE1LIX0_9NEOP|nr:H2.0-like homeobox protein [Frankliniella fusca]